MAVAWVTARYEHTVGTPPEGGEDKRGVYPSGAHHPNNSHVCWVFKSARPSQICACVAAPVAAEGQNDGFEFCFHFGFLHLSFLYQCRSNLRQNLLIREVLHSYGSSRALGSASSAASAKSRYGVGLGILKIMSTVCTDFLAEAAANALFLVYNRSQRFRFHFLVSHKCTRSCSR